MLVYTQISDNKYFMPFNTHEVHANPTKCTPKRTLIIFYINVLAMIMKKKQ